MRTLVECHQQTAHLAERQIGLRHIAGFEFKAHILLHLAEYRLHPGDMLIPHDAYRLFVALVNHEHRLRLTCDSIAEVTAADGAKSHIHVFPYPIEELDDDLVCIGAAFVDVVS